MEINVFKLCSCLKFLGYSMILLVAGIIVISYYAVVVVTWGPVLLRGGAHSFLASIMILLFHLLLVLLLWCYFRAVFTDPGSVPENWRPVLSAEDGRCVDELGLGADSSDRAQGFSYCNHCHKGKPPRCHHCSVCQRCVLKMDHHCVWVVNCVGACNYKFFLLFLVYTFLETTINILVLLPGFIKFFDEAKNHSNSPGDLAVLFLAFVLNLAFSLSLLCFIVMHASMLSSNTTSIEMYEKKGVVRWKYDLGRKKNFEQVFGTNKALWFLPIFSKEDLENIPSLHGLDFPTNPDAEA
ncbi:DHHC-type zinc finger family protein [Euphorbia peplus]|nr:DHHC-type zinc finger family protein [Euphorbia peplus]